MARRGTIAARMVVGTDAYTFDGEVRRGVDHGQRRVRVLRRALLVGVVALCTATLAACGGGNSDGQAKATVTVTATVTPTTTLTPTETPTESSTAGAEPNVGARALRVGQPRVGSWITTTLEQIR